MSLDFGKLNAGTATKQTDPRKIFTTLKRDGRFKRPLDEQSDVLDAWYARRPAKDLTIKMNTGGGKTVVGLLCLQSSLNENIKPAVYVTPDNYLVTQVLAEADALGITATDDEKDPDFLAGRSILVVNVYKLINGRSVFGVGEKRIPIGCIVIDDAHACLGVVNDQFSVKSKAGSPVYDGLLALFEDDLKAQSPAGLLDVKAEDPTLVMSIPYWAWQSRQDDVVSLMHTQRKTQELEWSWPLLSECIPLCTCVFGGGRLEIAPRFVPIDRIPSFATAQRRIYMTATLADDAILVSHFQADASEVADPIRPKGGGDIGDRMILAPQEINPDYTVEEIKALVSSIADDVNVVVIVPSKQRVDFWKGVAAQILDRDTIHAGVERLRAGHVGLTVLINKYDGIDLPGEACELLVIDGLPEVYALGERLEMQLLDGTNRQLVRQIQRIEQGMGRGVRSSDDHCVVLLLGGKLTQRLHQPDAEEMFSSATRAQITLGKEVATQVRGQPLEELEPILDLCLEQDDKWVQAGRNAVVNAPTISGGHLDENQVKFREAFDAARIARYDIAIAKAQEAVNGTTEAQVKGYLKQQLAEYTNFTNPSQAQELQLAALGHNSRLLKPIAGATYNKLSAPPIGQAAAAIAFMERFLEGNDLVIWVNGLLDDLDWGEEGTKRFEAAMLDLGKFLGFGSQRPEEEVGRGPDNLWALGGLNYLVIECKSGAVLADRISKGDTNQLNGSIIWFGEKYDKTSSATPIMVHLKTVFEHAAAPHPDIRIVNDLGLKNLRGAVRAYSVSLASSGGYRDAKEVAKQLQHYRLSAADIVGLCSVAQGAK
ncbi:helicase C-terminal domain-containing protein [Nisaea nitritireducens]|uniref:helicase C-terminal domain-containing protein n=1 Tax=Nisaea nitritireducens TaxID=568392 RepID=UPI001868C99A|nr:helicase C-terminal domain-containing protein [Nisaea nitritireducens]